MRRVTALGLFVVVLAVLVGLPHQSAEAEDVSAVLDANPAPGFQGATAVERVAPGDIVALEVRATGLMGAVGYAVTIEYDDAELMFDGWNDSEIIPGLADLTIEDEAGTVEIGGASLGGSAEVDAGLLGVVRFKAAAGFSGGAEVSITEITVSGPDGETMVEPESKILIGAPPPGPVVLDGDVTPGWQRGIAIPGVEAGQVVTLEIHGSQLQGATGWTCRLEFDNKQLAYEGYRITDMIPGLAGLQIRVSPGLRGIGGVSLDGVAMHSDGRLATVRFRVLDGFTGGADVKLVRSTTYTPTEGRVFQQVVSQVRLGTPGDEGGGGTQPPTGDIGPLALDLDTAPGDQGDRELKPAPAVGAEVEIEVAITAGGTGALAVEAVLEYDETALEYSSFQGGDVFSGGLGIPKAEEGVLNIGLALLGGSATLDAGSVGTVTFTVLAGFSQETVVKLVGGQLAYAAGSQELEIGPGGSYVVIGGAGPSVPNGDFDGDGIIGFTDFITFAQAYGTSVGDPNYSAGFDMDQDGAINFLDFVKFAQVYGKPPAKLAKTVSGPVGLNTGASLALIADTAVPGERSYVVRLSDASAVEGFGFTVKYDAAALEYASAENLMGSTFESSGSVALQVDRSAGTVMLADALPVSVTDGDLVRLTFRELTGAGRVEISQAMVSDPGGRVDQLLGARLEGPVDAFVLHQNTPNPFNPQTQISYNLPEAAQVRLSIYSVNGQKVADLVDAAQAPGRYRLTWDARDTAGQDVASGVYFYRMEANGVQLNRKMLLLR